MSPLDAIESLFILLGTLGAIFTILGLLAAAFEYWSKP